MAQGYEVSQLADARQSFPDGLRLFPHNTASGWILFLTDLAPADVTVTYGGQFYWSQGRLVKHRDDGPVPARDPYFTPIPVVSHAITPGRSGHAVWMPQAGRAVIVGSDGVLGIDACKHGWFGIGLDGPEVMGYFAGGLAALVANASAGAPLDTVAIDIPIGLPDHSRRKSDLMARKVVGRMRPSVFFTPTREAILAVTFAAANERNRVITGDGVSAQAYSLRTKLLEAEQWTQSTGLRVIEVHPEVSFATLAGGPLADSKRTWSGIQTRRQLLESAGIRLRDLGAAGREAGVDDVLDAAIAAWTALRRSRGRALSMPDPPEIFSDGIASAIWA